ncbi:Pho81p [Cyberlindnera jadinii NRRL Y-1542]|uniref:Ankyrin n=1 Tax=Cyberlindnera jadinii (strain ATCC 18201 / CBS 1600 / BCRC 20928 / JCM 3617 / NBRC 0987 / NRRL Y-1542) TaxID=983966 RepID=A0A1E4S4Q1_CYBJN|nr:ankyrin [Cyberlindnera jadinii NRRL Y-1542]ODV74430.1 ankyrin [Cyberlindnera jadinii NRRL Y-1542]
MPAQRVCPGKGLPGMSAQEKACSPAYSAPAHAQKHTHCKAPAAAQGAFSPLASKNPDVYAEKRLTKGKFGKHLESRQLELPEYVGHFINYKALKKLIKQLAAVPQFDNNGADLADVERLLQENKTSFFFRLERELEKVNSFYLEKESDLQIRLDILIKKKNDAVTKHRLGSKTSIAYITLYDGFKRFSRDLDRLEQFVELNQTGFSKVLKKWDKRSKSHTKELYLSKAVSVQPVFNRSEISQLSDLCANSLVELDANAEGEHVVRYDYENGSIEAKTTYSDISKLHVSSDASLAQANDTQPKQEVDDFEIDELYSEFLNIANSSTVNSLLVPFVSRVKNSHNASYKLTKIFFLSITTKVSDETLSSFYDLASDLIILSTTDDLSQRSIIHEACCNVFEKRTFIIELGIKNALNLNSKDISGRIPLHYAAELGRTDLIELLCTSDDTLNYLNKLDYDAMSPLILAIEKNHLDTVKSLLQLGADPAPTNSETNPQHLPLNVACKSGNYEAAELLLTQPRVKDFQKDAEGLLPLHVVAKTGNFKLVPLLTENGADPNSLDGFNKWPAIFYSASEGHPRTTAALIKAGAKIEVKDEEGFTPLFYASWEGHVSVLNVLINALQENQNNRNLLSPLKEMNNTSLSPVVQPPSFSLNPEVMSIDVIPDLSLPPPIIPLRRYGHNFLEKKIILQLHFHLGRDSISLNQDEVISSLPGRIVISSRISDVVPRNVLLPVADTDSTVAFQIDSLDEFTIDFEIFPSFGTKLIAKTSALSNVFKTVSNDGLSNSVVLPLFDGRLKNVGELSFNFQVIHPYSGEPLEISKYDTYWKSTSGNNTRVQNSVLSFVTASSLSGDYAKINVCMLSDGTPIVCPSWNLEILGTKLPLFQLSVDQVKQLTNYNVDNFIIPETESKSVFYKNLNALLSKNYILFDDFLSLVPEKVGLDVEVLYPTEAEVKDIPLTLPDISDLNEFTDNVLTIVFEHVRRSRSHNVKRTRSIVFSSNNQSVCSILNWKQPNYPVFFSVSGVCFQEDKFVINSANGFPTGVVSDEDTTTRSLKEATNFATLNNLLGIMVPSELLALVPDLVDSIRSRGLVLVASKKGMKDFEIADDAQVSLIKGDINGFRFEDTLSFKGNIDM